MIWLNEHETSVSRSNWKNSTVLVFEQLKTARPRSKTNGTLRSSRLMSRILGGGRLLTEVLQVQYHYVSICL